MPKLQETRITPAEWEIMRVLWDAKRPITATEVAIELEGKSHWQRRTVRTFINRLVKKKVVEARKRIVAGLELLHFSPLVCESDTIQAEQENFLDRFFGGTVHSMLSSCIQKGQLSQEEMKQLCELLDREIGQGDADA